MKSNFNLTSKRSDKNLYIRISGCFDGSSAWELINTINRKNPKRGNVFVDTDNLREVVRFGKNILETNVGQISVPPENIYFTGKYHKYLMPGGCRYYHKNGNKIRTCSGNCKECSCNPGH